jgi:iron complex outermembrane receptor protein
MTIDGRIRRGALRGLVLAVCVAGTADAVQPPALTGTVVDASGGAVSGAAVRARHENGTAIDAVTAADGSFAIAGLPAGRVRLAIARELFRAEHVDLQWRPESGSPPVRVVLAIAGLTEAVRVEVPRVDERPAGLVATTIGRDRFEHAAAFSAGELLALSPGVTVVQGNGPRDVSVSVRGSNARQTFGIRNIQVFEDGFPVTQPDGLARTDLVDPHAYGAIDVFRGPSSALFGNYAVEGAINFRTRTDVSGADGGLDLGSFGYRNVHGAFGLRRRSWRVSGFGSHVTGDGFTAHTAFATTTGSVLLTYSPSAADTITLKLIDNATDTDLSIRLSQRQFEANPFQRGCAALAGVACAGVSVLANGVSGARVTLSPEQAGLGRDDRRTIAGARWERVLGSRTTWRTQAVFDNRDINQPTSATSAIGRFPSINVISDVTRTARIGGLDVVHFGGVFVNGQDIDSRTVNLMPGGGAALGAVAAVTSGRHLNAGMRFREEVRVGPRWTGVLGLGVERTRLSGANTGYRYPVGSGPAVTVTPVARTLLNVAPEATVYFRPGPSWQLHARVAAGYGTPQLGNLFVTPEGVNGTNLDLRSQRNVGVDLGLELRVTDHLTASAAWFRESYWNELVTQSPGPSLLSFTFNAPRSLHQGLELATEWRPLGTSLAGLRLQAAYTWNGQRYQEYEERLSAGTRTALFDRAGQRIPGVTPHHATARLAYDHRSGRLAGAGAYVEVHTRAAAFVDNGNLLRVPGYSLVNLNLHYDPRTGWLRRVRLLVDLRNLANAAYVASASNLSNTLSPLTGAQNPAPVLAGAGGIYAGSPRSVVVGGRVRF